MENGVDTSIEVDWKYWLGRWDAMQTAYLPFREERFAVMLDAVEVLIGQEFVAIDLASGPGAISQRLLTRFPRARSIAVDYDPALLALGRGALGDMQGRLRWVEANLSDPGWAERLDVEQVDAVLSTTALHWLDAGALAEVYRRLGHLLRPGGVVLNGDHMTFPPSLPAFRVLSEKIAERQRADAFDRRGEDNWSKWWTALAEQPGMESLVVERERRFAGVSAPRHRTGVGDPASQIRTVDVASQDRDESAPIAEVHEAALHDAGFRQVGLIWRYFGNGVLLAVR